MKKTILAFLFVAGCAPTTIAPVSAGATSQEVDQSIKERLAQPDGCTEVGKDIENLKASSSSDYWFFKGYCASETNVEKACDYYVKFLKVAKGDPRVSRAKSYISNQSTVDYPTCVLP